LQTALPFLKLGGACFEDKPIHKSHPPFCFQFLVIVLSFADFFFFYYPRSKNEDAYFLTLLQIAQYKTRELFLTINVEIITSKLKYIGGLLTVVVAAYPS